MPSSSSSKGLVIVIVLAVVAVGAGAAGWFLFNKSEPAAAEPSAVPQGAQGSSETPTRRPAPTLDPASKVNPTAEAEAPTPEVPPTTREYYVNGVKVRDHRPEGTEEWKGTPSTGAPDRRPMQATSTGVLTKALQLVMRECTQAIPPEERSGPIQKMDAVFVVSVKAKVATITSATVTLKDAKGPATDAAKSCIETKALAVTEGVTDPDLEGYGISTSYRF